MGQKTALMYEIDGTHYEVLYVKVDDTPTYRVTLNDINLIHFESKVQAEVYELITQYERENRKN